MSDNTDRAANLMRRLDFATQKRFGHFLKKRLRTLDKSTRIDSIDDDSETEAA
jgi:hypothetical protein